MLEGAGDSGRFESLRPYILYNREEFELRDLFDTLSD